MMDNEDLNILKEALEEVLPRYLSPEQAGEALRAVEEAYRRIVAWSHGAMIIDTG